MKLSPIQQLAMDIASEKLQLTATELLRAWRELKDIDPYGHGDSRGQFGGTGTSYKALYYLENLGHLEQHDRYFYYRGHHPQPKRIFYKQKQYLFVGKHPVKEGVLVYAEKDGQGLISVARDVIKHGRWDTGWVYYL